MRIRDQNEWHVNLNFLHYLQMIALILKNTKIQDIKSLLYHFWVKKKKIVWKLNIIKN